MERSDVDDAHHHRVDDSAEEPRDGAPDHSDHGRHDGGCEADLERGLPGLHQPAQDVEAVPVGAERVLGTRWQREGIQVRVLLVRVVEERAQETEARHENEDHDADKGELVLQEDPEDEASDAPGLGCFTAGRHADYVGSVGLRNYPVRDGTDDLSRNLARQRSTSRTTDHRRRGRAMSAAHIADPRVGDCIEDVGDQ